MTDENQPPAEETEQPKSLDPKEAEKVCDDLLAIINDLREDLKKLSTTRDRYLRREVNELLDKWHLK